MEVGYLGKRTLLARSPVNISPVTAPSHSRPRIPLLLSSLTCLRKRGRLTAVKMFGLSKASLTHNADPI